MNLHTLHSNIIQFKNLKKHTHQLFHFSTTIQGGVSEGSYVSFNLGLYSGDKQENIEENIKTLAKIVEIEVSQLYFPYQTHQDEIVVIDDAFLNISPQEQELMLKGVDAVITNVRGIGIGVATADCVPILIYDPLKNILAAIHAGWRGTVAKIATKTVLKMKKEFNSNPEDLIVGIAPSICKKCFEVGNEVVEAFKAADFIIEEIGEFNTKTQKYHLDLWEANKQLIIKEGVLPDAIENSNLCTFTNPDLLFSARRQTIKSGRMFTGGVLR